MLVKIDTKEKFHVITLDEASLTASMAAELEETLLAQMQIVPKNVVLKMSAVADLDPTVAEKLVNIQQDFYDASASFVICELQKPVEQKLDDWEFLELMNVTPTESEAWDIVQMEEIERELMDDADPEFEA
jgi:anti-anti-sigma regulatory factor